MITSNNKIAKTEKLMCKFKKALAKYLQSGKYEKAAAIIAYCAEILYFYNQYYTDDDLEHAVIEIADFLKKQTGSEIETISPDSNVVMFYDGFGLTTRGVALNYLNALKSAGYKVVYVSTIGDSEMSNYLKNAEIGRDMIIDVACHDNTYIGAATCLIKKIIKYAPRAALFYTTPNDVSGAAAFCAVGRKVDRFLIDLTDHAFWIGKCGVDYFFGSREMSAYIQHFERHIEKNRLIKLGVNLVIEKHSDHTGLPFDVEKNRYIFSGGALYKTLGDSEKKYYKIVNAILSKHKDLLFLYAGDGDDTELKKLAANYPNRVFHISERKDFYYLIENCVLYLNTYPMFGGMMMKYAASANKIPLTLKHNSDSDGLLLNQKNAKIEYDTDTELIEDAHRLLNDNNYLKSREELLNGTTVSETRFINNLKSALTSHKTDYNHEFVTFNTEEFRKEFLQRFSYKDATRDAFKQKTSVLLFKFPFLWICLLRKIFNKISSGLKK